MESQNNSLLQKYWEGRTSVDEEKELKNNLSQSSEKSMEDLFFAELTKRKAIESNHKFTIPKYKTFSIWKISSVAATIVVLIAVSLSFYNQSNSNKYVVNDPKKAYEISQQALMLVSSRLNNGKTYSENLNRINEVKKLINK